MTIVEANDRDAGLAADAQAVAVEQLDLPFNLALVDESARSRIEISQKHAVLAKLQEALAGGHRRAVRAKMAARVAADQELGERNRDVFPFHVARNCNSQADFHGQAWG
jgi:hypothetical protein